MLTRTQNIPNIVLQNGTRISCSYIPSLHGHTVLNLWVVDKQGVHIASRSFKVCCLSPEDKAEKISRVLNDLKLEIISHEAGAIAEKSHNDITKMMDFIGKRYAQLKVKRF